jgi:hypothetical protein
MKKLFYLLCVFSLNAYCQSPLEKHMVVDDIISKLKTLNTDNITEKVYLSFDKGNYNAGDTIYFKAFLTKGEKHQPSDLSGILYVDLIDNELQTLKTIKLDVHNGTTWGVSN